MELRSVRICNFGVNGLESSLMVELIQLYKLAIDSKVNLLIIKESDCLKLYLRDRVLVESIPLDGLDKPPEGRNELLD